MFMDIMEIPATVHVCTVEMGALDQNMPKHACSG
jgi:hypothetical protein